MTLDFSAAMAVGARDLPYAYDRTRTLLYALAVGLGRDPLDRRELRFVYEKDLVAVPTLASVLAWGAFDVRKLGVDYLKVLHGEQRLTLHRALPTAAQILADVRTTGLYDKGAGKGALVVSEVSIRDAASGLPLCTLETTQFARGDGGFAVDGRDSGVPRAPHPIPNRPPDATVHISTEPHQALLYRLLGDGNPLHADPDVAQAAGFERPILHGLCTYGVCCHAILRWAADYQADRLRQFDVRFSAPVFPGETLRVEIWREGPDISFRAFAADRNVLVINNGYCRLGSPEEPSAS